MKIFYEKDFCYYRRKQFDKQSVLYVLRTRRSVQLAEKLTSDGYSARPFNGKMEANEKIKNQNDFIDDKVRIIVATSAFGMGVDKSNIGLVVHYNISDSLENYVQGSPATQQVSKTLCRNWSRNIRRPM